MSYTKVKTIDSDFIEFDNRVRLSSWHNQDCCESHYLSFEDIKLEDFEGLEFDLSGDSFFERVEDYGIRLIPLNGHPISIPGYSSNNGYYSNKLELILTATNGKKRVFNITECQSGI